MKRFDTWPALLEVFLASRKDSPFVWGGNDCCLFACDAVRVMTGTDLAWRWRASYHTALGAYRAVKEISGAKSIGELAGCIAELHKLREVPAPFAQRGDVVLLIENGRESLGIVSLDGLDVFSPGVEALASVPLARGNRAWRI